MVSSLQKAGSIKAEDEENIVAAILKREKLGSAGIELELRSAQKHGSTDKLIAAIALAKGVDFASLDGEPVLSCSCLSTTGPTGRSPAWPGKHLAALA